MVVYLLFMFVEVILSWEQFMANIAIKLLFPGVWNAMPHKMLLSAEGFVAIWFITLERTKSQMKFHMLCQMLLPFEHFIADFTCWNIRFGRCTRCRVGRCCMCRCIRFGRDNFDCGCFIVWFCSDNTGFGRWFASCCPCECSIWVGCGCRCVGQCRKLESLWFCYCFYFRWFFRSLLNFDPLERDCWCFW